jgi:protein-S-isoprenylcysteine O-methyltransferase Ste14
MHLPPVFIFPEAIIFWISFIWFFYLEFQKSRRVTGSSYNSQDAGTHRAINIGTEIALFLAFVVSFLPWFAISRQRLALDFGIGLLISGSLFRQYCIRILGECFTAAVVVNASQPIIEDGPYHWIRHPGYASVFIVFLAIGFSLGNWISLVILFLELCFVYKRRVKAEEKAMLEIIGEPYRAYMARTKRFIPFIF